MSSNYRHILSQGPVLAALGRTAFRAFTQRPESGARTEDLVGRTFTDEVPPRSRQLIDAYVRAVGGDSSAYRGVVPAHLFPQWGFPLLSRTLDGVPYPMMRVLNGGCRLQVHAPLPANEPLQLIASLEGIDDDGLRAILHQRLVTGTASSPGAVVADLFAFVPLRKPADGEKREKKEAAKVNEQSREVARFRVSASAGFDFACLTGDFNPIHWIAPAARAFGFKSTILHGFATMARTIECLNKNVWCGDADMLAEIDVRFTRPLVLPAEAGVYVHENNVYVGDAAGGPAYLAGTFKTREENPS